MSIEDNLRKRLPTTSDEHDGYVAEIWRRMGESNQIADQTQFASRLHVLSAIRINDSVRLAAAQMDAGTSNLRSSLNNVEKSLAKSIDGLALASDTTGQQLAKWTKWLAIATFVLGAATIALVYVEWSKEHLTTSADEAQPAREDRVATPKS